MGFVPTVHYTSHFAGLSHEIIFFERRPQNSKYFHHLLIQIHNNRGFQCAFRVTVTSAGRMKSMKTHFIARFWTGFFT